MICPHCGVDCKYYRHIIRDGRTQLIERCPECEQNPRKGQPFISANDPAIAGMDITKFPRWGDSNSQPELIESKPKPVYHHLDLRSR